MNQTEIPFYWIDAFTSEPFGGGPTVVCIVDKEVSDDVLSNVAKETGVLETAFVEKIGESEYNLRWFYSDGSEAPFAGYATLAAAHMLIEEYMVKCPITFHTLTGIWIADVNDGKVTVFIPFLLDVKKIDDKRILEAFDMTDYVEIYYNDDQATFMILLENHEQVETIIPDQCRIQKVLEKLGARRVLVTARGQEPIDFVYRMFLLSREDYACGSAQTGLSPYWKKVLGKDKLRSMQPHSRVSELIAEPLENGVKITSKARILVKGKLYV